MMAQHFMMNGNEAPTPSSTNGDEHPLPSTRALPDVDDQHPTPPSMNGQKHP